jgi:hypothetical protein
MSTIVTKITNKEQGYTMVDVFSSWDKAQAFTDLFVKTIVKQDFYKWDIQTESKVMDKPYSPFLNK